MLLALHPSTCPGKVDIIWDSAGNSAQDNMQTQSCLGWKSSLRSSRLPRHGAHPSVTPCTFLGLLPNISFLMVQFSHSRDPQTNSQRRKSHSRGFSAAITEKQIHKYSLPLIFLKPLQGGVGTADVCGSTEDGYDRDRMLHV